MQLTILRSVSEIARKIPLQFSKGLAIGCLFIFSTSCTELDSTIPTTQLGDLIIQEVELGFQSFQKISGNVSTDVTLTSDQNWLMDGSIFVESGATLTIEAGTSIYAAFNEQTTFLSVLQGGRINAIGTRENPIFFTSIRELTSVPQPGDWGGIIINGNAPINLPGGTGEGEGGTGTYGGTDPADNSGTLQFVLIEYAGKQLGEDNELNGLSLNGVGNGTTIEYVQVLYGNDDGFEMFGGTVNLRYAVSLGNGDDSFDWTYGWTGKGQFWVAQQDPFDGDSGIEADNNEDTPDAVPVSNPTIANLTLIGASDGDPRNTGVVLRHGTQGTITNALVLDFSSNGLRVGETSAPFIGGQLQFINSRVYDNGVVDPEATSYSNADAFDMDASNQVDEEIDLEGFVGVEVNAFDPAGLDTWFISAPFIGAVSPGNDWTSGWIEFLR